MLPALLHRWLMQARRMLQTKQGLLILVHLVCGLAVVHRLLKRIGRRHRCVRRKMLPAVLLRLLMMEEHRLRMLHQPASKPRLARKLEI